MEHRHLRGVHYLEFTREIIMKRQMTLDGFSFVKTKQRYEIHICDPPCENRPCSHLVVIRETGI